MSETTMSDTASRWREVSHLDDLWEGEMIPVDVDGTSVLLVNVDGDVQAFKNRCPHQEWPLHDGDLDETKLTCAQHLWEFDVCSGKGINPSTHSLIGYPCQVDEDGTISVDIG